jgi:DNA-binding NtrC family response regulator
MSGIPHASPGDASASQSVPRLRNMSASVRGSLLASAIAVSGASADVVERVRRYAESQTPVVLVGETGTGKSYFARTLHQLSRRAGEFVDVTAAELDPERALSDVFGHVRGAFTGAHRDRPGLLAAARGGTVLFDDFHLLRSDVQAMLLRTLDRGVYRPVGAERDLPVTARLVFGLGEDPDALVARGAMLKDLRFRLGHCEVRLRRLEERREEIAGLAAQFLAQCPGVTGLADGPTALSPGAAAVLEAASYPGNLRELRAVIIEAFLHARADGAPTIEAAHLSPAAPPGVAPRFERRGDRTRQRALVAWALSRTGGHVGKAAALIGAGRNTVAALKAEIGRIGVGESDTR